MKKPNTTSLMLTYAACQIGAQRLQYPAFKITWFIPDQLFSGLKKTCCCLSRACRFNLDKQNNLLGGWLIHDMGILQKLFQCNAMPSAVQLTKNLVVLDLFWECKIYILEILLWGRQRRVYPIYFISWVLMIKTGYFEIFQLQHLK